MLNAPWLLNTATAGRLTSPELFCTHAPRGNADDYWGRFDGNGLAPFTGPNHVDLVQEVDHGPDGGAGAGEGDVDPFVAEGGEVGNEVADFG